MNLVLAGDQRQGVAEAGVLKVCLLDVPGNHNNTSNFLLSKYLTKISVLVFLFGLYYHKDNGAVQRQRANF